MIIMYPIMLSMRDLTMWTHRDLGSWALSLMIKADDKCVRIFG
jgi:hypothetical protein